MTVDPTQRIDAYFEPHGEQGPLLDRDAVPVGIVASGYVVRGMHVDVHGETADADRDTKLPGVNVLPHTALARANP